MALKGTKSSSVRPPTSGSYCSSSLGLYRTLVLPGKRRELRPPGGHLFIENEKRRVGDAGLMGGALIFARLL